MTDGSVLSGGDKVPSGAITTLRQQLRTALNDTRNADGGWAYSPGHRSRIEPTCWSLVSLAHADNLQPDVDVIRKWPRRDGWLVDVPGVPPNITFNAIAALTLLGASSAGNAADSMIDRLVQTHGETMGAVKELRQDNSLPAWPWIDGTYSWVEPTAWCLLALKKRQRLKPSPQVQERIRVGEAFLSDRACAVGGWNYGNPNVYGTDLIPHVPTTAIGLLALQDRRKEPVVTKALSRLQSDAATEPSPLTLALSILCFQVYGIDASRLTSMLVSVCADQLRAGEVTANLHATAMALYALGDPSQSPAALTI